MGKRLAGVEGEGAGGEADDTGGHHEIEVGSKNGERADENALAADGKRQAAAKAAAKAAALAAAVVAGGDLEREKEAEARDREELEDVGTRLHEEGERLERDMMMQLEEEKLNARVAKFEEEDEKVRIRVCVCVHPIYPPPHIYPFPPQLLDAHGGLLPKPCVAGARAREWSIRRGEGDDAEGTTKEEGKSSAREGI
jgi:hypothetical protein